MWIIDRNTLYRERMTKGVIDERVLYRGVRISGWEDTSLDNFQFCWRQRSYIVWDRIELPSR
jgi:hypothetical protein